MEREALRAAIGANLRVAIGRWRAERREAADRRHPGAGFGPRRRIVSDRTLAEEVVQEGFLRLWNDPERFDPARGALRSYVLAQVHGRSVDLIRAESARRAREERDAR